MDIVQWYSAQCKQSFKSPPWRVEVCMDIVQWSSAQCKQRVEICMVIVWRKQTVLVNWTAGLKLCLNDLQALEKALRIGGI